MLRSRKPAMLLCPFFPESVGSARYMVSGFMVINPSVVVTMSFFIPFFLFIAFMYLGRVSIADCFA